MRVCVFCDSTQNLNTAMSVVVDGNKMQAHVCDEHADDASPKRIKEVLREKANKIKELETLAASLGYKLVPINSKKKTNKSTPQNVKPKNIPKLSDAVEADVDGEYQVEDLEYQNFESQNASIQIPSKIKSNAGETVITIKQTDDKMLQERTKAIAAESLDDSKSPHSYSQGYDVKDCPLCDGIGTVKKGAQKCPKCKGEGLLPKH